MILLSRNKKIKILGNLLAIFLLFFQITPKEESKSFGDEKLPELNIDNNFSFVGISGSQPTQNIVVQNAGINLSPANNFFDRFNIISMPGQTDSKKIYRGGFSYCYRYKTFLSVIFSTST